MDREKVIDIAGKIDEALEKERRVFPCRSNRASQIGHPCLRYLTHMRKDWEKGKPPSLDLQYIFEGGREDEKSAFKLLEKAGLTVTQQQRDFESKEHQITGHIDGKLEGKYPLEIKGMSQWGWNEIHSMSDMIRSEKIWVKGYPAQIQVYLLLAEEEVGVMCLYNKQARKIKDIWVNIDFDYCEGLLKKAEIINSYLNKDGYPDRMPFDPNTCMDCAFAHLCQPEIAFADQIEVRDDNELAAMLKERSQLEPLKKDYEKLDAQIKEIAKVMPKETLMLGEWMITRKSVTINRKPSPGGTMTQTRVTIKHIGGGDDEEGLL